MFSPPKIPPITINFAIAGLAICLGFINQVAHAALWSASSKADLQSNQALNVYTNKGNYQRLDSADLAKQFSTTPASLTLEVPLPEGGSTKFVIHPSPVMSPALAARYPDITSYQGYEQSNPQNIGSFSFTQKGLSGIFSQHNQWVLISPLYPNNPNQYVSYYYQDALSAESLAFENELLIPPPTLAQRSSMQLTQQKTTGEILRTYRLALSTTGEYTAKLGGTKADVVAEMVSLVTRVNQILLADIAIRFELVDNHGIIFTDAQDDPFTNSDQAADIETNQQVIDNAIGTLNYDIGHLFGTNPGGLAYVGSVCNSSFKAQGYSGNTNPRGERFYIDLVIHEFGHHLGAKHSFNAQDQQACDAEQRNANTAFEPGSGSTIMSYSGICGEQNIQDTSDPYFHAGSIRQILNYVDTGLGRSCGTNSSLNNAPPQIELAANAYVIPANTPFVLTAPASDPDGDNLVYNWEQLDAGGLFGSTASAAELQTDNGANPLFRSYPNQILNYRYFPRLADVLANRVSLGEAYPSTDRELNFRVSVKDGKGGVNTADVAVEVIPNEVNFAVIEPTVSSLWQGNSLQRVSWNTASTELGPINCLNVDIRLDLDGDRLFDSILIIGTANDGEQIVPVPNTTSNLVRLQIQCSDNVFYAVSQGSFEIEAGPDNVAPTIVGQQELSIDEDNSLLLTLEVLKVSDPDSTFPENFSLKIERGNSYNLANDGFTIIPESNFNGELSVSVTVNDGIGDSAVFPLIILVNPLNDAPVASEDAFTLNHNSAANLLNVLANDNDIEDDPLNIISIDYAGNATVTLSDNKISYQPAIGFFGSDKMTYTISDDQLTSSADVNITVLPPPSAMPATGGSSGGTLNQTCHWFMLLMLMWRRASAGNRCQLCKN